MVGKKGDKYDLMLKSDQVTFIGRITHKLGTPEQALLH